MIRKGRNGILNRRGNAFIDTLMIVVFLFVIAIGVGTVWQMFDDIGPNLVEVFNESGYNTSVTMLNNQHTDFPTIWDGIFVFLLFGLWMAALIGSFFIDSHPIFFIITIFILVPIIIVGVVLGNTYEDYAEETDVYTFQTDLPMTYWIMTHFLPIVIVVGISIATVLYAKNRFI